MEEVKAARAAGKPTVPSTMGLEKQTNPFLRPDSAEIRKSLGMEKAGRCRGVRRDPGAEG